MSTDHDLEYGPTPPGAQYEHTDIAVSIGYNFAIWLLVAMVLSLALVYGVFWYFEGRRVAEDVAVQQFPLAVDAIANAQPLVTRTRITRSPASSAVGAPDGR